MSPAHNMRSLTATTQTSAPPTHPSLLPNRILQSPPGHHNSDRIWGLRQLFWLYGRVDSSRKKTRTRIPWTGLAGLSSDAIIQDSNVGAVAQLVRALDCRSRGCGFDPRRPRSNKPRETSVLPGFFCARTDSVSQVNASAVAAKSHARPAVGATHDATLC